MNGDVLAVVACTLLGGSGLAAVTQVYVARKKTPAERDSVIVTGAETAVTALERSLAAETKRADRLEAETSMLRARIAELEKKLDAAQAALDTTQDALDSARAEIHTLSTSLRDRK